MVNIDYIMDLLDWNRSEAEQSKGLKMAKDVKNINVFLQPGKPYGKSVWDNCAKILAERTDDELSPYLIELMAWLQDMNWPGSFCMLERLQKFKDAESFDYAFNISLKYARAIDDEVWEANLRSIKRNDT